MGRFFVLSIVQLEAMSSAIIDHQRAVSKENVAATFGDVTKKSSSKCKEGWGSLNRCIAFT